VTVHSAGSSAAVQLVRAWIREEYRRRAEAEIERARRAAGPSRGRRKFAGAKARMRSSWGRMEL
jgi:hypothetical protein